MKYLFLFIIPLSSAKVGSNLTYFQSKYVNLTYFQSKVNYFQSKVIYFQSKVMEIKGAATEKKVAAAVGVLIVKTSRR